MVLQKNKKSSVSFDWQSIHFFENLYILLLDLHAIGLMLQVILFSRARIHQLEVPSSLSKEKCYALHTSIKKVKTL